MLREFVKQMENKVPIQPYTNEELAYFYNITGKTLGKWIEPFKEHVGIKIGWFYNIRQIEIIFENLGRPEINRMK